MPDQKYYWLTESDRKLLDTLAQERRAVTKVPRQEAPTPQTHYSPEVFIARTPITGIPALTEVPGDDSEDIPGYAECRIYKIVRDYPESQPRLVHMPDEDRIVYNVFLNAIGGNRWVPIKRMREEHWVAEAIFPFPSETDPTGEPGETGTGTGGLPTDDNPPVYPDTGTGTNPETGGPSGLWTGYPGYYACAPVAVTETDVFCEPGTVSVLHTGGGELGTGTGTDLPATQYYLNLYRRTVMMGFNRFTGCLESIATEWQYVRTIGCCEPECVAPDTGTGVIDQANCCQSSLYHRVGYTLNGPTASTIPCTPCTLAGYLYETDLGSGVYHNDLGGSTCGGRAFLDLTLYCSGTTWRAKGRLRRYTPFVEDTTQEFDVALTLLFPTTLQGIIDVPGCSDDMTLLITNPCYSYNCVDDECVEAPGDTGAYATLEECQADCEDGDTVDSGICGELSTTLSMTLSDCACLGAGPITLTYNAGGINAVHGYGGADPGWVSEELDCGAQTVAFYLWVTGPDNIRLEHWCDGVDMVQNSLNPDCDPFVVLMSIFGATGCCGAEFDVVITE